jgi:hypothetical protein
VVSVLEEEEGRKGMSIRKVNSRENSVAYWCSREESVALAGCMASVWEEGEAGRE